MNARPTPTPPGPPTTYIWTWVDARGFTITEHKKPPAYVPNPTAYIIDAEGARQQEQGHAMIRPLCDAHAMQVGPNRHLCPEHAAARTAALPELF